MIALRVAILLVLLLIFFQDIKGRSVYWFLFPLLSGLFLSLRFVMHYSVAETGYTILANCIFIAILLLILSGYFSGKNGKWVNITNELLGWGDILFFGSIAFYFSLLNFLFVFITSLIAVLLVVLSVRFFTKKDMKHIPLAGMQALFLSLCLSCDWWFFHLNLTNDYWLLNLMNG